jgi:RNA polymerase sigma-70 factor (ECF subfamily)
MRDSNEPKVIDPGLLAGDIREGDSASLFTNIYNNYHRRVQDTAYHICRCSITSEEITQVCIKKEYLHQIKDIDAWLFMMARNLSIDFLRKQKFERTLFEEYSFVRAKDVYVEEFRVKEVQRVILEAVEQLHPQQKRVYQLKRFYGWKRDQIAKQLNISENTVKATMQKALHSVKKYVKERVV